MKEECINCKFWEEWWSPSKESLEEEFGKPVAKAELFWLGSCRRYPPTAYRLPVLTYIKNGETEDEIIDYLGEAVVDHVTTKSYNWCGEWKMED